jgi:hypothetical protein
MLGFLRRSRLHGESSPLPPGRAKNACRSFAVTASNSLNLTPLSRDADRIHPFKVIRSLAHFSSSSQSVFLCAIEIESKQSFCGAINSLPFLQFFFGDWIIAVDNTSGEYVVNSCRNR